MTPHSPPAEVLRLATARGAALKTPFTNPEAVGDVLLSADDARDFLREELRRSCPRIRSRVIASQLLACPTGTFAAGRLAARDAGLPPGHPETGAVVPPLVFARQLLPAAQWVRIDSIRGAAETLFDTVVRMLPENLPWLLQVAACYGGEEAGANRSRLIREAVVDRLKRQRRSLRRTLALNVAPLTPAHSVAQLLLTQPDLGLLSVAVAPEPFRLRRVLSPFAKGLLPVAGDKAAPCRAFAKLVEAESRLGQAIAAGETCVDLGASPGSWSYVALARGASVTAVDRAPLRADLMANRRLRYVRGDAFGFTPDAPVDWLLCDVIAAPERSISLLRAWVERGWARRFVVTIKFKGSGDYAKLDELKLALLPRTQEFFLLRLCANHNEACAFGTLSLAAGPLGSGSSTG